MSSTKLCTGVVRVNAVVGAGEVTVAGGVTPSARLSWTAAPDPRRAGFEVLWRETTDPRWTVYQAVPPAADGPAAAVAAGELGAHDAEVILTGVSTDNHFFAVRAVGVDGARSIPVAAVLKPPPPKP